MPNYVPIQDMTISHNLEDTDLVPVSDGNTSFAVQAAKFKAYSTDAAEAAAAAAAAAQEAAEEAASTAVNASSAFRGELSNGDDLNNLYENGWYATSNSHNYLHSPEPDGTTGQRLIIIYSNSQNPTATRWRVMFYYNLATRVAARRIFVSGAWQSWVNDADSAMDYRGELTDGDDLNDLYKNGWYTTGYAHNYLHSPEPDGTIGQRLIYIMASSSVPGVSTQRYMFYYNLATGVRAFRLFNAGSWNSMWLHDFSRVRDLSNGDDLNDLYINGWYTTSYSHNYLNSPEPDGTTGQRLIFVYGDNRATSTTYRIQEYINIETGVTARRIFVNGAWLRWTQDDANENTRIVSFSGSAQTSQGENVGTNIRVMSYNVAQYNNNTSDYISDIKLFNLRKFIGKVNADFVCTQEDMGYIDSGNTKGSHGYVFLPQYPYQYRNGAWANILYSKRQGATSGRVKFTQDGSQFRGIEYCTFQIGSIVLLLCGSHPSWTSSGSSDGSSATNIAIRKSQYQELMKWANGDITLKDYTSNANVSAPNHTHCVICADMNSATQEDMSNLASYAATNHYVLGNGGALGWFATNGNSPLDNIVVSDNIIINHIESMSDWYRRLYSDHNPVYADLTLL